MCCNVTAYGSAHAKMILARLAQRLRVPYLVHIHAGRFADFWTGAPRPLASRSSASGRSPQRSQSAAIMVLGRTAAHTLAERLPALRQDQNRLQRHAMPAQPAAGARSLSPDASCLPWPVRAQARTPPA
jgi:hypothetical protein